jgi:hypothetical protein
MDEGDTDNSNLVVIQLKHHCLVYIASHRS